MKYVVSILAFVVAACGEPCAPRDEAILDSGWWYVRLADGTTCIARPFEPVVRDTDAKAIAECRAASSPTSLIRSVRP